MAKEKLVVNIVIWDKVGTMWVAELTEEGLKGARVRSSVRADVSVQALADLLKELAQHNYNDYYMNRVHVLAREAREALEKTLPPPRDGAAPF